MTREEILQALYDETLVGNRPRVLELTQIGLDTGLEPEAMLFDALIPSLEEVGARFERGDFFVPEMLIAGKAMAGALSCVLGHRPEELPRAQPGRPRDEQARGQEAGKEGAA